MVSVKYEATLYGDSKQYWSCCIVCRFLRIHKIEFGLSWVASTPY
jgi:hypothetical protein